MEALRARQWHSVSLVDINAHTGGMVSGGLAATDMGDRKTVGGLADDFFLRIVRFYREKYGADSQQFKACRDGHTFEPHVAEAVFDAMLAEQPRVKIFHRLRYRSLAMDSTRITSLTVENPGDHSTRTFAAKAATARPCSFSQTS